MTEEFTSFDYVFPIFGGDDNGRTGGESAGVMEVKEVYGTAFCIAENLFLTNDHVLRNAIAHSSSGIGFLEGRILKLSRIQAHEFFPSLDMAIFSAAVPKAKYMKWRSSIQPMLADVQATGFPYALDLSTSTLSVRSFRGTIVSSRTWHSLNGKPAVYELSFPCPRGLSGSPLLRSGFPPTVIGVIFGNPITDMIVNREVEKIEEKGTTTIYERTESLHLGLAVQTKSILAINSSILKTTIGDFLQNKGLLQTV
jgi:hypothetical protein